MAKAWSRGLIAVSATCIAVGTSPLSLGRAMVMMLGVLALVAGLALMDRR